MEGDRPGGIDDPSVDLGPEIDFHDVIVLKHGVVAAVGSVVRRDVIETASRGKGDSPLQSVFSYELSIEFLQAFAHVHELDSRSNERLGAMADLPVNLGGMTELFVDIRLQSFVVT